MTTTASLLQEGYWSPVTASIDWCEVNYEFTYYIAEFWNCLSSLGITLIGVVGLVTAILYKLEFRFILQNIWIMIVGFGSAAFHGTLLYTTQMWDELPMIWAMINWIFVLFQMESPKNSGSIILGIILTLYGIFWSYIHYTGAHTTAFQVQFTVMAFICAFRSIYLHTNFTKKAPPHTLTHYKNNHDNYNFLMICYLAFFVVATISWLIDTNFCHVVSTVLPFNPQLHSVWHVMMGFTVFYHVQYGVLQRVTLLGNSPEVRYFCKVFPFVHFKESNGHQC